MMKYVKAAFYLAVSLFLFFLLRDFFPKYAGAMKVYLVLWILDGYLWISTRAALRKKGTGVFLLAGFFYWLPLLLILGGIVYGWFFNFLEWNIFLRTEFLNIIQIGYAVKVLPVVTRIIADLLLLVFGKQKSQALYGVKQAIRRNWLMTAGWGLGFLLGAVLLAGHLFWQYGFRVEKVSLEIRDLPSSFDKMRIVQLSDLHLGNWNCLAKLAEAVERTNNLRPDLIFITGDVATFSTLDVARLKSVLAKLSAKEGIFVIYGNHDYGQYYKYKDLQEVYDNMDRFGKVYRELGWTLLCNEQKILIRGPDSIAVLGVENWGAEERFPKLADIVKAEKGTENIATKLLLSHDPTYWEKFIAPRHPEVDVTFSGHTHGGQIGIETQKLKYSLVSMLHPYWAGLYSDTAGGSTRYLYVNRGLGTVGYSGRIGIAPEITLFLLTRKAN
jgi:predicted MPP superfamily phosphohydrolase